MAVVPFLSKLILDTAISATRDFLELYPLRPHLAEDLQRHVNPQERHGTIIIPLLRQSPAFNSINPKWPAFNHLLDSIMPIIHFAQGHLKEKRPQEYNEAVALCTQKRATILLGEQIQSRTESCFESVRLNANVALDMHFATSNHPSQMMVLFMFGPSTGRDCYICYSGTDTGVLVAGKIHVVHTDVLTLTNTFRGERYELQFFLPNGVGSRPEEECGRE